SLFQLRLVQVEEAFVQQLGDAGAKLAREAVTKLNADVKDDCQIDPNENPPILSDERLICITKDFKAERAAWMLKLGSAAKEEAARSIEDSATLQQRLQTSGYLNSTAK